MVAASDRNKRHEDDGDDVARFDLRGQLRKEIKFGGKEIGAEQVIEPLPDRLDIIGGEQSEYQADKSCRQCRSSRR